MVGYADATFIDTLGNPPADGVMSGKAFPAEDVSVWTYFLIL